MTTATSTKSTYHLTGTVIAESHLATCGPALSASKEKNAPQPIPTFMSANGRVMYMPGAGFRSKLRGAACAIIMEALRDKGAKLFTLLDAQVNRVGGIKQKGDEPVVDTTAYLDMITSNPIMGVFGAATPWVSGKVKIGHLICKNPNLEPMIIDGVRTDILKRNPSIVEFLDDSVIKDHAKEIARTKNFSAMKKELKDLNSQMYKAKGDEKTALKEQISLCEAEMSSGGHEQVSALMPLDGYMAIPPGAEMESLITLVGVSQIELGCFFAALNRFAEEPFLGAHSAHGAGIISGKWEINKIRTGISGTVELNPFVGANVEGDSEIDLAVKAFYDFIQSDACQPYAHTEMMSKPKDAKKGKKAQEEGGNDE